MTFREWIEVNKYEVPSSMFNFAEKAWQASREAAIDECAKIGKSVYGEEEVSVAILELKDK